MFGDSVLFYVTIVICFRALYVSGQEGGYCTAGDGRSGSCLNLQACPELYSIFQNILNNNGNDNDKKFLQQSVCSIHGNIVNICCPQRVTPCVTSLTACGETKFAGDKVVGGRTSQEGDFPWVAALGYNSTSRGRMQWKCGGSLITDRHILTAAHCLFNENPVVVRLGEQDISSQTEVFPHTDYGIQKIYKHPEARRTRSRTIQNDIAIIQLDRKVTFTEVISPICLPCSAKLKSSTFDEKAAFVAGWGQTAFGGLLSNTLQYVQVPVISNSGCGSSYSELRVAPTIQPTMLCAGAQDKDSCLGDSGGPLITAVIETNVKRYYQIGIVSSGYGCGAASFPGIYTRVTEYLEWIASTVRKQ